MTLTMMIRPTLLALALAGAAAPALAGCPAPEAVDALAADILAGRPAAVPEVATMADGLCAQAMLVERLAASWGAPAGHKAGLTSAPAQNAFGVTAPVRGRLFGDRLLEDGASLPAAFGALPRYEADFVVEVGDAAINAATTPAEVMANLAALHPFIELPDLVVADPRSLTGPKITAINVGARTGVLGPALPVADAAALTAALAAMQVVVRDGSGAELARAPGAAILGHPLNAVLWLIADGVTLQPGDLVSLGSFGPLLVPQPGLAVTVTYEGLPGNPAIGVRFE